jgi:cobalt transporter subunit CbtB
MQIPATSAPIHQAAARSTGRVLASVLALAFGTLLLWGVGFAHNDLLHNAAHDTRHSNGFPCH